MANDFGFETLVNPFQRAHMGERFAADDRFRADGNPGALTLRGFAAQLERLAAQVRELAQTRGTLNLLIDIDEVIIAPDARTVREYLGR